MISKFKNAFLNKMISRHESLLRKEVESSLVKILRKKAPHLNLKISSVTTLKDKVYIEIDNLFDLQRIIDIEGVSSFLKSMQEKNTHLIFNTISHGQKIFLSFSTTAASSHSLVSSLLKFTPEEFILSAKGDLYQIKNFIPSESSLMA